MQEMREAGNGGCKKGGLQEGEEEEERMDT